MSRQRRFDPELASEPRGGRPLAALLVTVALLLSPGPVATPAAALAMGELRLTTENDLLVTDQDDLYTFAVALELQRGGSTFAFRESAFTDRAAGLRFDESQLSLGRRLPAPPPWTVYAEGGVVHVGEGLLGERAQNAVHGLIGGEEVELPYAGSSLHGRLALTAERSFPVAATLHAGPLLQVEAIPGLRSHAVLGAQAAWRPRRGVDLFLVAGARLDRASHPALERHVEATAPLARLGLVLWERVELTWTLNDYGDGREHLSLGYRVPGRRLLPGAAERRGAATGTTRRVESTGAAPAAARPSPAAKRSA